MIYARILHVSLISIDTNTNASCSDPVSDPVRPKPIPGLYEYQEKTNVTLHEVIEFLSTLKFRVAYNISCIRYLCKNETMDSAFMSAYIYTYNAHLHESI